MTMKRNLHMHNIVVLNLLIALLTSCASMPSGWNKSVTEQIDIALDTTDRGSRDSALTVPADVSQALLPPMQISSPQDQIQAFRTFQIAPELRETQGYPELTPALKAKVFGLNAMVPYRISAQEIASHRREMATADRIEKLKDSYRAQPEPHFATYGPRTRRQFFNLLARNRGQRS